MFVCACVYVRAPPPLTRLSCPPACKHISTSHTLALGRSGSTRDVPAKSSSTSSLDPNTCHTKPWQPPASHYLSYSIYRRYTSLSHTLPCLLYLCVSLMSLCVCMCVCILHLFFCIVIELLKDFWEIDHRTYFPNGDLNKDNFKINIYL